MDFDYSVNTLSYHHFGLFHLLPPFERQGIMGQQFLTVAPTGFTLKEQV